MIIVDKSSGTRREAAQPAPLPPTLVRAPTRTWSRRHWLGATVGAAAGALVAEAASLAGSWDHERPSPLAEVPARGRAAPPGPRLTHVGHSCHLIEMAGQRWLTDPWFFDPAFGALRHSAALHVSEIGPLDGIFISHRHADHFDPSALRALEKSAAVWVADPALLGPLAELGFARVSLSAPWLTLQSGGLRLGFAPALHDVPQHSLYLGGEEASLLFCADTGFHEHWQEIRRRFQPTTALLPCDGTRLRWEERRIMNAAEAARAALELGCRQLLQTHADARYSDPLAEHLLSATDSEPLVGLRAAIGASERARRTAFDAEPAAPLPEFTPLLLGETRALLTA